jgi:hypothetical protein
MVEISRNLILRFIWGRGGPWSLRCSDPAALAELHPPVEPADNLSWANPLRAEKSAVLAYEGARSIEERFDLPGKLGPVAHRVFLDSLLLILFAVTKMSCATPRHRPRPDAG